MEAIITCGARGMAGRIEGDEACMMHRLHAAETNQLQKSSRTPSQVEPGWLLSAIQPLTVLSGGSRRECCTAMRRRRCLRSDDLPSGTRRRSSSAKFAAAAN
jgi:hypothetical protein